MFSCSSLESSSSESSASTSSSSELYEKKQFKDFVRKNFLKDKLLGFLQRDVTNDEERCNRMPPEEEIRKAAERNIQLRGNFSAMYSYLMRNVQYMEDTNTYSFKDMSKLGYTMFSEDGYVRAINSAPRAFNFNPGGLKDKKQLAAKKLTEEEGQVILAKLLRPKTQNGQISDKLLKYGASPIGGGSIPRQFVTEEEKEELGKLFNDDSFCLTEADLRAEYAADNLQTDAEYDAEMLPAFVDKLCGGDGLAEWVLSGVDNKLSTESTQADVEKRLSQARAMLLSAVRDGKVFIVKREFIEKAMLIRYIGYPWTRKIPLYYIPYKLNTYNEIVDVRTLEEFNGNPAELLRKAGTEEFSRIRRNVGGYGEEHGLGIPSSGMEETTPAAAGPGEEKEDPAAVTRNWMTADIEKVMNDCVMTNPELGQLIGNDQFNYPEGKSHDYANEYGEWFHDVAQNTKAASSIEATYHTQIMRMNPNPNNGGKIGHKLMRNDECDDKDFTKVLRFVCDGLNVTLKRVGSEKESVIIVIQTPDPTDIKVLKMLLDLKNAFFKCYRADVQVGCYPHVSQAAEPYSIDYFNCTIAPVCLLSAWSINTSFPIKDSWVPPADRIAAAPRVTPYKDYSVTVKSLGYEPDSASIVDASNGKGNLQIEPQHWERREELFNDPGSGLAVLGKLYDLNRLNGVDKMIIAYFNSKDANVEEVFKE